MTTIPFKDATPVLQVKNLNVTFAGSPVSVLDGISLTVRAGETLALVGESGCGKSITSLALMGLLPASARIVSGEMQFRRHDLRKLSPREYADLRGSELAMIFQEPMTSLNPAFTLGRGDEDRAADPRESADSGSRDAIESLSPPAFRRHAPARDDCHGADQSS